MATIRRWYILLVCAISLQSVTWAVISLLRNLLITHFDPGPTAAAFQIAVIVIGLPVFLAHWFWEEKLAEREPGERESGLRRFYLYAMFAGFLAPFIANAFDLIGTLLRATTILDRRAFGLDAGDAVVYHLTALFVLAAIGYYHWRVRAADSKILAQEEVSPTVRRIFILGFSAAGLILTILGVINLLRWIIVVLSGSQGEMLGQLSRGYASEVTRLIVGISLWLVFWLWAQRLFNGPSAEERESVLRKFYIYSAVFIGALGTVGSATVILAGGLRQLLALPPKGNLSQPISIIVGTGLLWAYHAFVLREDATKTEEAPRQAGVRRLYHYLIAAIGLSALLVGLSGDLSVILRSFEAGFGSALREQLAWFTAALIAGLPVWLISWQMVQSRAVLAGPEGVEERQSLVRKIYLYFFLFVATMAVLSSAVYIVYRLLSLAMGEGNSKSLFADLGQAIAYLLIAVGVWLYHGASLRNDSRLMKQEQMERLEALRIVVMDGGEGQLGSAVLASLRRELPGLSLTPVGLTAAAAAAMGVEQTQDWSALLSEAGLVIAPWTASVARTETDAAIASALIASPMSKLLFPLPVEGWEWAGVERWSREALARQIVHAVKQITAGEEVKPARPPSGAVILGIFIGIWVILSLINMLVSLIFGRGL